jgi:hypothetical protein
MKYRYRSRSSVNVMLQRYGWNVFKLKYHLPENLQGRVVELGLTLSLPVTAGPPRDHFGRILRARALLHVQNREIQKSTATIATTREKDIHLASRKRRSQTKRVPRWGYYDKRIKASGSLDRTHDDLILRSGSDRPWKTICLICSLTCDTRPASFNS